MQRYLFDLKPLTEEENKRQIEQAKQVIKESLLEEPEKLPVISFSCGKDSLLLLLLVYESLQELKDNRTLLITTANHWYNLPVYNDWFSYLKETLTAFNWLQVEPPPLRRLSVETLGIGTMPLVANVIKWCNSSWKQNPLKDLNKCIKGGALVFSGTRNEESIKRKARFNKLGYKQGLYIAPLSLVTSVAVWSYLEKNLYKLGVSFYKLQEFYKGRSRDGCWCCVNNLNNSTNTGIHKAIGERLKYYYGIQDDGSVTPPLESVELLEVNKRNSQSNLLKRCAVYDATPIEQPYRTKLEYCQKWYLELLALQRKYNTYLLNRTDKKLIFEIWNWRAQFGELITQKAFLESVESGKYKLLFPEVFNQVFRRKQNRYIYIYGVIKWIHKNKDSEDILKGLCNE